MIRNQNKAESFGVNCGALYEATAIFPNALKSERLNPGARNENTH